MQGVKSSKRKKQSQGLWNEVRKNEKENNRKNNDARCKERHPGATDLNFRQRQGKSSLALLTPVLDRGKETHPGITDSNFRHRQGKSSWHYWLQFQWTDFWFSLPVNRSCNSSAKGYYGFHFSRHTTGHPQKTYGSDCGRQPWRTIIITKRGLEYF
jgi:hypothetical protein